MAATRSLRGGALPADPDDRIDGGLGLLPAALSHGIGSETQRPFAVVIVGGIVSGTIFTLMLLPMLFARFGGENGRT